MVYYLNYLTFLIKNIIYKFPNNFEFKDNEFIFSIHTNKINNDIIKFRDFEKFAKIIIFNKRN